MSPRVSGLSPGDNLQVSHPDLVRGIVDGLGKNKEQEVDAVFLILPSTGNTQVVQSLFKEVGCSMFA